MDLVEQLQNSFPHPVFHKNRDGVFLGCNSAFVELMGVDRDHICGVDATAFMSGDLLLFEQSLDAEVLDSGQPRSREYGMRDRAGEFRNYVYHKAPFHDASGAVDGIVGVILDVTEKAWTSRKLKRSQDLQDAVLNSIDDAILVVHAVDRTITLVNPAVASVFGYEPEELIGQSTEILHVDRTHFQQFATDWDPELDRSGAFRIEYPMRRKDGSIFPTEITVAELSREHGWRAGVVSLVRDISDRKRAEEQILRHQRTLETVLGTTPDVMLRIDREHRVLYANPAVRAWAGVDPESLTGRTISAVFEEVGVPRENREEWVEDLETVFRNGTEVSRIRESELAGRTIWADSRLIPEFDARGNVVSVLSINRDITRQKQIEEQLAEKDEQLRQAQRMESIGRLAGGVAHDFNNILTAVGGYLHMAVNAVGEDQSAMLAIDGIRSGVNRAAGLTKQLLLFSRKTPSEKKRIDLNAPIKGLHKMLDRLIGENISIEISCAADELWIDGDDGKIEQVVMNLILNAVDAMPEGGIVRVRTELVESEEARSVLLVVEDNGVGMDNATQARVFEPFFTTKPKGSGTGLGLAVVYGIVQEHGGAISVQSRPGEGASFSVRFPESREVTAQHNPEQSEPPPAIGGGGRILIVEDETEIVSVVSAALREVGYDVVAALDIASAYREWSTAGTPFDLVVSDVVLPDGSGVSLLDLLKPVGDTRFVFVSGYLEDKVEFDVLRGGGYPFIHKPYTIAALQQAVAEELSRRSGTDSR